MKRVYLLTGLALDISMYSFQGRHSSPPGREDALPATMDTRPPVACALPYRDPIHDGAAGPAMVWDRENMPGGRSIPCEIDSLCHSVTML